MDDPRAPPQLYDDRGRPVNPETRRINRDVIRSHNEVMMVIGVAEPDTDVPDAQAVATRKQRYYEDNAGKRLFFLSGLLQASGIWGVNGMRQRILVRSPNHISVYGIDTRTALQGVLACPFSQPVQLPQDATVHALFHVLRPA